MRRFRSFDGTEIAYTDEGSGDPVVLLHGAFIDAILNFGSWQQAAPFMAKLATGLTGSAEVPLETLLPSPSGPMDQGLMARIVSSERRVIAPDMRGHGHSGRPAHRGAYADRSMARDVIALLDHLDLTAVHVVGYSMGSITAAHLVAIAPGRVRSLVLGGIGAWIIDGEPIQLPDELPLPPGTPRQFSTVDWCEQGARSLLGQDPEGLGSMYRVVADAIGMDPAIGAAVLRDHAGNQVLPHEVAGFDPPVLVLNGEADWAKNQQLGLARYFKNIRFGACSGDHLGAVFDAEFQRSVLDFLASNSSHTQESGASAS